MEDLPAQSPPQAIVQVVEVYSHRPETSNFRDEKVPRLNDGDINRLPVVQSRELSQDANSTFQADGRIKSLTDSAVTLPEVAKIESVDVPKVNPYESLSLSDTDRAHVSEIITILAENGKLSLLFKKNHLKELGSQINHLHPLKFLSAIFSNPALKARMGEIFKDYFKRNGFMGELSDSLTEASDSGELNHYIEKFAREVNVPAEEIRPYFLNQDWEGLIDFLIYGK